LADVGCAPASLFEQLDDLAETLSGCCVQRGPWSRSSGKQALFTHGPGPQTPLDLCWKIIIPFATGLTAAPVERFLDFLPVGMLPVYVAEVPHYRFGMPHECVDRGWIES
jgi:hypothetical protein